MTKEFSGQALAEGIWPAVALYAKYGGDDDVPRVQITAKISDGPNKGAHVTYEDEVNNRSALYIQRSCRAVGWRGVSLTSLKDDVAAWIEKTGGETSVEVKHIEIKKGKNLGKIWAKPNSIGRGPRALKPLSQERISDADEAMRRAMELDGATGGTPPPDDVPPAGDDDIPFITSSMAYDRAVRRW